jgi:cytochrome c peroxidase
MDFVNKIVMSRSAAMVFVALFLSACGGSSSESVDEATLDSELSELIAVHQLSGDPVGTRVIPDINDPEAQLGMKLFYSKALSGSRDTACVSCHHPLLGGGDGLSLSIGSNAVIPDLLGMGRTHSPAAPDYWMGSPTVPRNAPSTFNVALYTRGMFWDSRVEAYAGGVITPDSRYVGGFSVPLDRDADDIVSAQARFPVTSEVEMRGYEFETGSNRYAVRDHLAARIGDYGIGLGELVENRWLPEFQAVYGDTLPREELITYERIAQAIGVYERSQLFVDNPWHRYVRGVEDTLSIAAKRGALLFLRTREQGGANCIKCHTGDFYTDEQFHVVAIPQIGRGRGDGLTFDDDYGRFKVTGIEADKYVFRTPTLLNVEETGPWGHAGSYTTLEAVVKHYANPVVALEEYDFGQIDQLIRVKNTIANTREALKVLQKNRENGLVTVEDVPLSAGDVGDLVAFLKSLTDPCIQSRDCLQPWIPTRDDHGPDGLLLQAVDAHGKRL